MMPDDLAMSGGCQCGAVRYHATSFRNDAHICHCRMCQKAVGNYFEALVGVPLAAFSWTRGTPAVFQSSEHVERGFCHRCGTPLFYRDARSEHISLTIGALDHPERIKPATQDGIEGRMPWFATLTDVPDAGETEAADPAWAAAIKASNYQHPDHDTETWTVKE